MQEKLYGYIGLFTPKINGEELLFIIELLNEKGMAKLLLSYGAKTNVPA